MVTGHAYLLFNKWHLYFAIISLLITTPQTNGFFKYIVWWKIINNNQSDQNKFKSSLASTCYMGDLLFYNPVKFTSIYVFVINISKLCTIYHFRLRLCIYNTIIFVLTMVDRSEWKFARRGSAWPFLLSITPL